jgi:segregation and condensation protein B
MNGAPDSAVVQPTSENPDVGHPDSGADEAAAARAEKARTAKLRAYFRVVLDELVADYASPESERGLEIREVAGGFRFGTKPEYHDAVRGFVKSLKPPLKLTLQALETLAVVAYKQPVTAPEISEIRGVDSSGVLGSLLARKLITTAGRKHVIGRPILYKTTREFLLKFGLKDVAELPSIEEFEKMAGQLTEQEEIPMESEDRESPKETEERLESDGEAAAPEPVADELIVDGRLSGLPPKYDDSEDDPSAVEGKIQRGE